MDRYERITWPDDPPPRPWVKLAAAALLAFGVGFLVAVAALR